MPRKCDRCLFDCVTSLMFRSLATIWPVSPFYKVLFLCASHTGQFRCLAGFMSLYGEDHDKGLCCL